MVTSICISREVGAGGEEVGRQVADRLGFRYVDEEILDRAAELGDIDVAHISGAEQRKTLLQRLLEATAPAAAAHTMAPADDSFSYVTIHGRAQSLRNLIRQAIDETAAEGNVVIVAHAASHALAEQPGALRVLIIGSPQRRAQRQNSSTGAIAESDKARADYLQRFYGIESEQPSHYDLVVNTDKLSPEQATDVILAAGSGVTA